MLELVLLEALHRDILFLSQVMETLLWLEDTKTTPILGQHGCLFATQQDLGLNKDPNLLELATAANPDRAGLFLSQLTGALL